MDGRIVHCSLESKVFLTRESEVNGRASAVMCNLDGSPLSVGQSPRAMFRDTDGRFYALISHEEKEAKVAAGDMDIFQGVGSMAGWFVPAPDHTINGHHGNGKGEQPQPLEA